MNATEKQLRRLNRMSLLEIIVEQKKQIEDLQSRLTAAEKQIESRNVTVDLMNVDSWNTAARFMAQICGQGRTEKSEVSEMVNKPGNADTAGWFETAIDTEEK